MTNRQVAWWLWAIGSVLIALSWFNVVSNLIGWIGFAIGMAGSIGSWGVRPPVGDEPVGTKSPGSESRS